MKFADSTAAQMAAVTGGWFAGFGLFGAVATSGEISAGKVSAAAIVSWIGFAAGMAAWIWGSRNHRAARANNIAYTREQDATEHLARRRHLETRLVRTRQALLAAVLIAAGTALIALMMFGLRGVDGEQFEYHYEMRDYSTVAALAFGALLLPATALARVHREETDALEVIASDYQRRRDNGTPGLNHGRWD